MANFGRWYRCGQDDRQELGPPVLDRAVQRTNIETEVIAKPAPFAQYCRPIETPDSASPAQSVALRIRGFSRGFVDCHPESQDDRAEPAKAPQNPGYRDSARA